MDVLAPYRDAWRALDRRGTAVVLASFLIVASRMGTWTFLGIHFVRDVGIDAGLVGAAFLVENLMRGVAGPMGGALSDRVGRRAVMIGGVTATALVLPGALLVDSLAALFAWSALVGAAQAVYFPAASALLLDLVPPARRMSTLATNYAFVSLGYTMGVAPAGFLAERGLGVLVAASTGGLVATLVLLLATLRGPLPATARSGGSVLGDASRALRDPPFLLLSALAFCFPVGIGLVSMAVPLYAADAGVPERVIGVVLASTGVLLAALSIPVNARLEGSGPYRMLAAVAVVVAASYAVLSLTASAWGILAALAVFTLAEVVFSAALPTAVAGLAPPGLRGAYQGAWSLVFSLGIGVAFFLAGESRDAFGWEATWLLFAAASLAAGAGLAWARPRFRRLADARAQ